MQKMLMSDFSGGNAGMMSCTNGVWLCMGLRTYFVSSRADRDQ